METFIKQLQEIDPELNAAQIQAALNAVEKISKPDDIELADYYNYLAIFFLEQLGNDFPSQVQIDYVESFLSDLLSRRDHPAPAELAFAE